MRTCPQEGMTKAPAHRQKVHQVSKWRPGDDQSEGASSMQRKKIGTVDVQMHSRGLDYMKIEGSTQQATDT
eukprot:scaffold205327_cov24-Tisochrysis_lutea.AAC.1